MYIYHIKCALYPNEIFNDAFWLYNYEYTGVLGAATSAESLAQQDPAPELSKMEQHCF